MTTLRHFSLGRHAMKVALQLAEVKTGDSVMVPGFICRDLLAAINSLGAVPVFYEVDINLQPKNLDQSVHPRAIIAVNYFGFAQDLAPFIAFGSATGAIVIEDNAHGFLSRDSENQILGQRTTLGITSFRKTLHVADGATLSSAVQEDKLPAQLPYIDGPNDLRTGASKILAHLQQITKIPIIGFAQTASRLIRYIRTGSKFPTTDADVETKIPGAANPHTSSVKQMLELDQAKEISRRRILFEELLPEVIKLGIEPIFKSLPNGTCPYGLPVYASPEFSKALSKLARRYRVTLMTWPELPQDISPTAPEHYQQVQLLNFR